MGNSNSSGNTRTENYKTYKIVGTDEHSDWIRCHLDDYVPYSNGNYKHMDFKKNSTGYQTLKFFVIVTGGSKSIPEEAILVEGYHIAVDTNMTRDYSSNHNFSPQSARTVRVERTDSDVGFLRATGELCEEINKNRERYARAAEYSRWLNQTQAWTSSDIPPRK